MVRVQINLPVGSRNSGELLKAANRFEVRSLKGKYLYLGLGVHNGKPRSKSSTVNATAHFVNVLNRRLLGRRQTNQGFRIACAGVFGTGAYGDSPHVHLAFQAPAHHSHEEMSRAIAHAIKRTRGLGSAYDIQPYTSQRWFEYMLDHGTDGLMVEFITPAKH